MNEALKVTEEYSLFGKCEHEDYMWNTTFVVIHSFN